VSAMPQREDTVAGDEIVRHRRSVRIVHGAVALFFVLCLLTGMPIWSPVFGWMAALFGGLGVCRWLHPWSGVAFSFEMCVMYFQWRRSMAFDASEKGRIAAELARLSRHGEGGAEVGKYNVGQKLLFWFTALAALAMLGTGLVMWFPESFPWWARGTSMLVHDATFVAFAVAIVVHVYLGTAAEPGTFRSITRGTVTRPWAKLHHPRWFREVTGGDAAPK
jgi:formate dehydrogenase subunit gamma